MLRAVLLRQPAGEDIDRPRPQPGEPRRPERRRFALAPADRRNRLRAGVEDEAAGPRRAPVASLDRGIDAATDERRADGAAVERDREAVTRCQATPKRARTAPPASVVWVRSRKPPSPRISGRSSGGTSSARPPRAAVTSSRSSSSIAIGVGATVATPLDGAPSERWRAIASSSESPARTAVGQPAMAIDPRPRRLRQRAMTGLLGWRPTPTARGLPAGFARAIWSRRLRDRGRECIAIRVHARNLGSWSNRCPDSSPWVKVCRHRASPVTTHASRMAHRGHSIASSARSESTGTSSSRMLEPSPRLTTSTFESSAPKAMRVAALDLKRIIETCISYDVMKRLNPAKPATRPDARYKTR